MAVLEDEHQDAVGRSHRQQVEQDRLDGDHDRADHGQVLRQVLDPGHRAAEQALASAEAAQEIGARVYAARARTLAGRALAQAGERERAVAELEAAARELEACGARRYRDEARFELRKLGRRFHRRPPGKGPAGEGVDALTERELEVARLVVDRRTNPEIAGALFLSEKTVESHMRNIFRKLDVSRRADAARVLERVAHAPGSPTAL